MPHVRLGPLCRSLMTPLPPPRAPFPSPDLTPLPPSVRSLRPSRAPGGRAWGLEGVVDAAATLPPSRSALSVTGSQPDPFKQDHTLAQEYSGAPNSRGVMSEAAVCPLAFDWRPSTADQKSSQPQMLAGYASPHPPGLQKSQQGTGAWHFTVHKMLPSALSTFKPYDNPIS